MESQHQVCKHYSRKCRLKTRCCPTDTFGCLQCHDEFSSHKASKEDIKALICINCQNEQTDIDQYCNGCHIQFGKYFCKSCSLFDDNIGKGQFHCTGCGLCRLGGADNYFHCETCEMCLPKSVQNSHKCVEKISQSNCPVCQEDLHTSREPCQIPPCHHLLHKTCFDDLVQNSHFYCPTCSKSLIDLQPLWQVMQNQIDKFPMQGKYQNVIVNVICRDCNLTGKSTFHVIGLVCNHCYGFNTVRTDSKFYSQQYVEIQDL